ncbi:MAG: oligoendopeptidase F family protein, partial [Anaerolineales bacterium]|nr:oligoendopeptidase F family protein [Anaerolineales bacterium]
MSIATPPRGTLPRAATWNAESVFADEAALEAEIAAIQAALPALRARQGALSAGPLVPGTEGERGAALAETLEAVFALRARGDRVVAYSAVAYYVDTGDPAGGARWSRAQGLASQVLAATSFLRPELLALGAPTLEAWAAAEPRLAAYAHFFADLFRKQAHVRSAEVEEMLGLLAEPFASTTATESLLTDADFVFPAGRAADGAPVDVNQSSIHAILAGPDREARRTAWENYADVYLDHRHSLTNNLATSIKQNVFLMRARRQASTLALSLSENNIPPAVFHNLIETFRRNLPTWHRYWRVRRRALGVATLHPYDVWAPLTAQPPVISYPQAVEHICAGLAPLGAEYVNVMRRGCLEERWVDYRPNQGKFNGAFSWGAPGTHPFIVMAYTDDIFGLSTLAHELGHSMHSYLSWQTQPKVYADYSLFAAEVASNFHQAMTRAHLLQAVTDRNFQINVLEEALSNFHRYFFIMPTLARFELELHERVERGEGLNAPALLDLMADLFAEAYGGEVHVDRERVGITWAQFSHLYSDYYVYQYATGISAATAFSQRILSGVPQAAADYLGFLRTGSAA